VLGLAVRLVRGMDAVDDCRIADSSAPSGPVPLTACAKGLMADMDVVAKALVEQDAVAPSRVEKQ